MCNVCLCVCVYMWTRMCACEGHSKTQASSSSFQPRCLKTISRNHNFSISTSLTGQQLLGVCLSLPPSTGVTGVCRYTQLYPWILGIHTQVLKLTTSTLPASAHLPSSKKSERFVSRPSPTPASPQVIKNSLGGW